MRGAFQKNDVVNHGVAPSVLIPASENTGGIIIRSLHVAAAGGSGYGMDHGEYGVFWENEHAPGVFYPVVIQSFRTANQGPLPYIVPPGKEVKIQVNNTLGYVEVTYDKVGV